MDQTLDLTGAVRHRLQQQFDAPEFVKTASHAAIHGDDAVPLPDHVYADRRRRLFPCHTKAATFVSAMYFGDKANEFQEPERNAIQQQLQAAATHWGINAQIGDLWHKMATAAKQGQLTLSDDDFAVVFGDVGARQRLYPLRNPTEVKAAAAWFAKYRDELEYDDRQTIASRILTKSAAMQVTGIPLEHHELLNRCAGYGSCPISEAADACEKRATLISRSHQPFAAELKKLAQHVRTTKRDIRDNQWRIDLARTLDQIDSHCKLAQYYGQGLDRPEDSLFMITAKVASDMLDQHFTTVTGNVYATDDLSRLQVNDVRSWMGQELADILTQAQTDGQQLASKLATLSKTLPRPDAVMFDRMVAAAGIQPVHTTKTAQEIPAATRHELAAGYRNSRATTASAPAGYRP